jgi:pimeloyl-ACP methyl ester carboxylesterase
MAEIMVRSDDLELAAEAFGNPLDAALLLIMGVGGSMLLWPAAFCEKLASRGFYVLRYDNRDTGRSTFWPPGALDYGVDELAEDAISILDAFGVPRAHIVGLSMGGIVGQIAALAHPNRMLSLTLISSTKALDAEPDLPPPTPPLLTFFSNTAPPDWNDREAVIAYKIAGDLACNGSGHRFNEAAARASNEAEYDRARSIASGVNHTMLGGGKRWEGHLADIDAPMLVIHGDEDPLFPIAHGYSLAALKPDTPCVILKGTGHQFHQDDWQQIIAAIVERTETVPLKLP